MPAAAAEEERPLPLATEADRANQAIRDYVRALPGRSVETQGQRVEYQRLVDAYLDAVRRAAPGPDRMR